MTPPRSEARPAPDIATRSRSRSRARDSERGDSRDVPAGSRAGSSEHRIAENLIVEAEKFKASVAPPKGKYFTDSEMEQLARRFDNDDDFFHVTCHLDSNLKSKIENGEFIELDRLLSKDRLSTKGTDDGELLRLIRRDGQSFLSTTKGNDKGISSIRRWEQAFRVYAAVYSEAHPERAAEIWQYVHVINTAASSYLWDNVSAYDVTFRQLMAKKPWRSWAKTYTQGWNLTMRDHISNKVNSHQAVGSGVAAGSQKSWKDDCCWRFNKSSCSKNNSECRYDHRCTHCAGWGHGRSVCKKRPKNRTGAEGRSTPQANPGVVSMNTAAK